MTLPFLAILQHPQFGPKQVSDPLAGLLLRIHHQRPALAGHQDGCIFNGQPISWQTLVLPACHGGLVSQSKYRVQTVCQRDRGLDHEV